jgi:hypothetical protein
LPNILKNNENKLDVFWDSFLLREKNAVLSTEQLNSIELSIDGEDEEHINTEDESYGSQFDIFKLLKIHKPIVDYYCHIIQNNHSESNLFLIDPRLMDYFGIEKLYGGHKKEAVLWKDEPAYSNDLKLAKEYFRYEEQVKVEVSDLETIRDLLRDVFLRGSIAPRLRVVRPYKTFYSELKIIKWDKFADSLTSILPTDDNDFELRRSVAEVKGITLCIPINY